MTQDVAAPAPDTRRQRRRRVVLLIAIALVLIVASTLVAVSCTSNNNPGQPTVRVDRGSTIHVEHNVYSVAARLIGEWVEARIGVEQIEVWYAGQCVERLPRLRGRGKARERCAALSS